jgi:hypothetical protein
VIYDCVIHGTRANLIRLVANYVKSARMRAGERDDIVIDVPGPLALLTRIEREILSFDRPGAVALRPRDEVLLV